MSLPVDYRPTIDKRPQQMTIQSLPIMSLGNSQGSTLFRFGIEPNSHNLFLNCIVKKDPQQIQFRELTFRQAPYQYLG